MQFLLLLVPCLVSAAPQKFTTRTQAQVAAQALEDRLNGKAAFGNSQPSIVSRRVTKDDNSEYKFSYKVADDNEQTYIAQEEQRAGDTVTGSYQYVDPLGSLIVVNYSAGPGGYQQTRQVKPNFVTIRARPVRTRVKPAVIRTVTRVIPTPTVTRVIPAPTVTRANPSPTVTRIIPPPTVTRVVPSPTVTRVIPSPSVTRVIPSPTVTRVIPSPTVTRIIPALSTRTQVKPAVSRTVTRVIPAPAATRVIPASTVTRITSTPFDTPVTPLLISSGSSGELSSVNAP